jgi:hypothetical protein
VGPGKGPPALGWVLVETRQAFHATFNSPRRCDLARQRSKRAPKSGCFFMPAWLARVSRASQLTRRHMPTSVCIPSAPAQKRAGRGHVAHPCSRPVCYFCCRDARRWCQFEFFYSAIDRPWFMQNPLQVCADLLILPRLRSRYKGRAGATVLHASADMSRDDLCRAARALSPRPDSPTMLWQP